MLCKLSVISLIHTELVEKLAHCHAYCQFQIPVKFITFIMNLLNWFWACLFFALSVYFSKWLNAVLPVWQRSCWLKHNCFLWCVAVQRMRRSRHRVKMMMMTGEGSMMIFWGKLPVLRVGRIVIHGSLLWLVLALFVLLVSFLTKFGSVFKHTDMTSIEMLHC